jgi:hypothetical protein
MRALRGTGDGQVFGAELRTLEGLDGPLLEAALLETLFAWKAHHEGDGDEPGLSVLSHEAGRLDRALHRPLPTAPPSFGRREDLGAVRRRRLAALDEALAGRRALDLGGIAWVGADMDPDPAIHFGEPDPRMLYAFALGNEQEVGEPFAADLVAFFLAAGSLSVDEDPALYPVERWSYVDEGLCIAAADTCRARSPSMAT